ncbi:hypothetical protein BOO69_16050 [Sulfitobacter alexandrii]|uniref:Uncharacterized protein n=1 Tax=Sulfitobacter alexandrii TaxID=1917485 RepID=A0A1J0WKR8_9RHOB|nr:hypothetical protein [Sulfitobacter alexandrii]APE44752.1 hypothetical protein BOO69_16050 [Sulfitobacter alexandrii]
MSRITRITRKKTDPDPRQVDWIVLTVSLIGILIVLAASIQAGEAGLVAYLGSYMTSSVSF